MSVDRVQPGTQAPTASTTRPSCAEESDKVRKIRETLAEKLKVNQQALDDAMTTGQKEKAMEIINSKIDHYNFDRERLPTLRFDNNQNSAGVSTITKREIKKIESQASELDKKISEKAGQMEVPTAIYKSISAHKKS